MVKKIELTQEQKIAELKERHAKTNYYADLEAPPAHFKYVVGDEVEVGNLTDCKVAEILADSKYYLVSYTDKGVKHGVPYDNGTLHHIFEWFAVFKKSVIQSTDLAINKSWASNSSQRQLSNLIDHALRGEYIVNPEYQRGYVWTLEDKQKYIDSVMSDRELGKFIFIHHGHEQEKYLEILDGKQRISALTSFMKGEFDYKGVYWHEMSKLDRHVFEGRIIPYVEIPMKGLTKSELLTIFLEVNVAGVPQTDEHLDMVRDLKNKYLASESRVKPKM